MKNIILLVIILPFLTSCNDNIQENDRLNSPEALTQTEYDMAKSYLDVNTIPQLPVEAWFLAAREFEHNNKDITDSAQYFTDLSEYLDTRLTELFPQEAYIGMMADIENYYDNFLVVKLVKKIEKEFRNFLFISNNENCNCDFIFDNTSFSRLLYSKRGTDAYKV